MSGDLTKTGRNERSGESIFGKRTALARTGADSRLFLEQSEKLFLLRDGLELRGGLFAERASEAGVGEGHFEQTLQGDFAVGGRACDQDFAGDDIGGRVDDASGQQPALAVRIAAFVGFDPAVFEHPCFVGVEAQAVALEQKRFHRRGASGRLLDHVVVQERAHRRLHAGRRRIERRAMVGHLEIKAGLFLCALQLAFLPPGQTRAPRHRKR